MAAQEEDGLVLKLTTADGTTKKVILTKTLEGIDNDADQDDP